MMVSFSNNRPWQLLSQQAVKSTHHSHLDVQGSNHTLQTSMKPDVQIYFTDPDSLLKKKLKEVSQVAEFQKNHRARLMAHQKKQLKKFKAVKDDFRKLLKNLKDLDNDRKRLSQDNDMLKKFISTSLQRSQLSEQAGSAHKMERGPVKSPYRDAGSSRSNVDSVLSKFIGNFNGSNSRPDKHHRVSVISPPKDGRLGIISGTPSPSSALQHLNLASIRSNESLHKKTSIHFESPNSTPGSSYKSVLSPFVTSQSTVGSPLDSFATPPDQNKYKRDVKKMVVHPFSPDDSPSNNKFHS